MDRFQKNKADFVRRFVTMDEAWAYHYDPAQRQQTSERTEASVSAPKQPSWLKSSEKVMASVFWDAKGILLIDFLENGKTIIGEYYCSLLDQLDAMTRKKKTCLSEEENSLLSRQCSGPQRYFDNGKIA